MTMPHTQANSKPARPAIRQPLLEPLLAADAWFPDGEGRLDVDIIRPFGLPLDRAGSEALDDGTLREIVAVVYRVTLLR
jgi:hypothetical protein